tara:strand:+ start:6927 stop:7031 length:105 start_codon:yes stop_codon:yes gene_type:complete
MRAFDAGIGFLSNIDAKTVNNAITNKPKNIIERI